MKHNDRHFFELGDCQFACVYDGYLKQQGYWYPQWHNYNDIFNIDYNKGFRTAKACEAYMRKQIYKFCKQVIKEMKFFEDHMFIAEDNLGRWSTITNPAFITQKCGAIPNKGIE